MMPDVAVQKAIRARLIASSNVVALVPAASILDRHERPAPLPSIIIGESDGVDPGGSIQRALTRVTHTLHIWKQEPSFEGVKAICGAVHWALFAHRLALPDPAFHCVDCRVSAARYLRDPSGDVSHGVMHVEVLVHGVRT